jgi:deazaflavin-dependent oxidoreductase (nitroreductase family)
VPHRRRRTGSAGLRAVTSTIDTMTTETAVASRFHASTVIRGSRPAEVARRLVLNSAMPVDGEYEPSPAAWVRDQVELYESSGGTQGTTLRDTGLPVVIVTNRGARSGKVHKTPVMRVEHGGRYAMVASKGGAPDHPVWYYNVRANPLVELQDGPQRQDMTARELSGDERAEWWARAVAAYPPYADYQKKTARQIPLFVLEPVSED